MYENYCERSESQVAFEKATSLQLGRRDEISTFLKAMKGTYEEATITKEQKFVFLSKTFQVDLMISNFVIFHSSQTFEKLIMTLKAYKQFEARFLGGTSYSMTEGT